MQETLCEPMAPFHLGIICCGDWLCLAFFEPHTHSTCSFLYTFCPKGVNRVHCTLSALKSFTEYNVHFLRVPHSTMYTFCPKWFHRVQCCVLKDFIAFSFPFERELFADGGISPLSRCPMAKYNQALHRDIHYQDV